MNCEILALAPNNDLLWKNYASPIVCERNATQCIYARSLVQRVCIRSLVVYCERILYIYDWKITLSVSDIREPGSFEDVFL